MIRKGFTKRVPAKFANGGMYQVQDTSGINTDYNWGSVATGAGTGAAAGMSAGPWGALAGAVIGGVSGAIGASGEQQAAEDQLAAINLQNAIAKSSYDRNRMNMLDDSIGGISSLYVAKGGRIPPSPFYNNNPNSYRDALDIKNNESKKKELTNKNKGRIIKSKDRFGNTIVTDGDSGKSFKYPQSGEIEYSEVDPIMLGAGLTGAASKLIGNELLRRSTMYGGFQLGKNVPSGTIGGALSAVIPGFIDDVITSGVGLIGGGSNTDNKRAKGGRIPNMSTPMNIKGNVKQVGAGVQVKGKKGKDTIPANIGGMPVRLDNEEIVVDYQGQPVVISDDLGEADKYRMELRRGGNPKMIADKFARRAMMLNPNPGINRALGGGNDWPPYSSTFNPDEFTRYGNTMNTINRRATRTLPNSFGRANNNLIPQSIISPQIDIQNIPSNNEYITNSLKMPFNSNNYSFAPTTNISAPTTFDPKNLSAPAGNYSGPTSSNNMIGRVGNYLNTPGNKAGLIQGLGTAATLAGNVITANRIAKSKMPAYQTMGYTPENIDVNRPIYEDQISTIKSQDRNISNQILGNTSNSNVALSRLGSLRDNTLGNINTVRSQQAADRGRISNANIQGLNRVNAINNQGVNQANMLEYQDRLGKINTSNALVGSTVQSLDNIVRDLKMNRYQGEQLNAIAKSYGLTGNYTDADSLYKDLMTKFGNQINTLK